MIAIQAKLGEHRSNNFDFVRLLAAFLVVWGHSLALLKLPVPGGWGMSVSTAGVAIFFALSGYLVTESWLRGPYISTFFLKRSLRIFPALAVCVLLCAFVLGPLLSRLSLREYFNHPWTLSYLSNIALYIRYNLPGVFENNTYPHAVNGSLWSLPVEFFCYITVAVLGQFTGRKHVAAVVLAGVLICVAGLYMTLIYKGPLIVWYATGVGAATSIIPYFFVGSLLRLFRDRISLRLDVALALCFTLSLVETQLGHPTLMIACWLCIPYIVLSFGLSVTPILSRAGRFGDLSYGMYLYSFPVQQTIVYLLQGKLGGGLMIVLSTIFSAAIAYASWHIIEKGALRLKPKGKRFILDPVESIEAKLPNAA